MIIKIYEGYTKDEIIIGAEDDRFTRSYGSFIKINTKNLYSELDSLSNWVITDLGEECYFEIG